jgi:Fe-S-cluster containining protein
MTATSIPLLIIDPTDKARAVCIDVKKWEPYMPRNEPCFCGSGKKQKRCHPDVYEKSVFAGLLKVINAVENERAAAGSPKCCYGCNDCCADYFNISVTEFFAILRHLKIGGSDIAQYVRMARIRTEGIVMPDGIDDRFRVPNWPICIFVNDTDGKCEVYSVRPLLCRLYGNAAGITDCAKINSDEEAQAALFIHNPYIDIVSNIDRFKAPNGQIFEGKARPLIVWFGELSDEGEFRSLKMQNLFKAFTNSPISEFVRLFLKP